MVLQNKLESTRGCKMSEETLHGIPRGKILWYSTIDYEKFVSVDKRNNLNVKDVIINILDKTSHQQIKTIHTAAIRIDSDKVKWTTSFMSRESILFQVNVL